MQCDQCGSDLIIQKRVQTGNFNCTRSVCACCDAFEMFGGEYIGESFDESPRFAPKGTTEIKVKEYTLVSYDGDDDCPF